MEKQSPPPKALLQYGRQRAAAIRRGIGWEFTFETWWETWLNSGHYLQRGPRAAGYCMARFMDRGPYAPSNVYICTVGQNSADHHRINPHPPIPQPPWRSRIYKKRTHCGRGHQYVEGSYTYGLDSHGRMVRRCRVCRRKTVPVAA